MVWFGSGSAEAACRRLCGDVSGVAGIAVDGKAKYLGGFLGPDAVAEQWGAVAGRIVARASEVGRIGRSLRVEVQMHGIYVAPLANYKL